MCGIVGMVNGTQVVSNLIDGLRKLEYRGYDSSGLVTSSADRLDVRKISGKLSELEKLVGGSPTDGPAGIAHTRWATHGHPSTENAHPHVNEDVAVVHNGIIENYRDLRAELTAEGHVFASQTDSEVIPHLIRSFLAQGFSPDQAMDRTLKRLQGTYALGVVFRGFADRMMVARRGSPLVLGKNDDAMMMASDGLALDRSAKEVFYLEDGDWGVIEQHSMQLFDANGRSVKRPGRTPARTASAVSKQGFKHFMLKEIHEQPAAIRQTLSFSSSADLARQLAKLSRLTIIACGTSAYAAQVAKYWFEQIARLPVDIDIASEFRYRDAVMPDQGAALFISQSGETADTLAALRYAREHKQYTIALVNVPDSTIAREADCVLQTIAGPEIGVASTKAFMTQMTMLLRLAIDTADVRNSLPQHRIDEMRVHLATAPTLIETVLDRANEVESLAHNFIDSRNALFMGRGTAFPIALEGALKLKEITYIHAEGYGAGELKHGPIALVDDKMPVVVLAPENDLLDKTISNLQEVNARRGQMFLISTKGVIEKYGSDLNGSFVMPDCDPVIAPLLYVVPTQLLAYYTAVLRGTDVDQPRNLAKSVTVE
ncbi:MAG: glutamine--fructose-6-phosphate transaminase (isomerizing) [Rhodospirillales bacterium]|nr:glutamine--fructose-6-phosphate transaminase (isomerizing) [Rhodospirillales bacterium]